MTPDELEEFWTHILKGKSPRNRERLFRLNPQPEHFKLVRGYFPKPMSWRRAKRLLQAGKRLPDWRRHRVPGGAVWGGFTRPADLPTAHRYGWVKAPPSPLTMKESET